MIYKKNQSVSRRCASSVSYYNSSFSLTLKNVTIGTCIDQNKKSLSLWPIGQKMLILHENLEFFMPGENFPLKKVNFWPMGQKDVDFLFWSTPEPMITFLGLKNNTSP